MGPIQARPLLRLGDDVVVLDERYLIERVTRGLYWLVHDHEKQVHGENARRAWTQVWGEMIETRVEDQLRQMAPWNAYAVAGLGGRRHRDILGGLTSRYSQAASGAGFPGTHTASQCGLANRPALHCR